MLTYHDDIRAPGRRGWLDYVMFQVHVLHVLVYDRELRSGVATQLLKMRAAVARIDSVRNDIGATNIEF